MENGFFYFYVVLHILKENTPCMDDDNYCCALAAVSWECTAGTAACASQEQLRLLGSSLGAEEQDHVMLLCWGGLMYHDVIFQKYRIVKLNGGVTFSSWNAVSGIKLELHFAIH